MARQGHAGRRGHGRCRRRPIWARAATTLAPPLKPPPIRSFHVGRPFAATRPRRTGRRRPRRWRRRRSNASAAADVDRRGRARVRRSRRAPRFRPTASPSPVDHRLTCGVVFNLRRPRRWRRRRSVASAAADVDRRGRARDRRSRRVHHPRPPASPTPVAHRGTCGVVLYTTATAAMASAAVSCLCSRRRRQPWAGARQTQLRRPPSPATRSSHPG